MMKFTCILATVVFTFFLIGCDKDEALPCGACQLEPEMGPCEAAIKKYYFDYESETCKEFIWGGCHGVVPFDTLEECEQCGCK